MHETRLLVRAGRGARASGGHGVRRIPRIVLLGVGTAVLAGLSSACHETLTQVDSRVLAPATRPALDIAGSLPRLADLVAEQEGEAGEAALGRWEDSWSMAMAPGGRVRAEIYRAAGERNLAFDAAATRTAIEALQATLAEIEGVTHPLPPYISRRLAEARRLLGAAEAAREAGDVTASVLATLRSADALRGTTPGMVALDLVEAAGRALEMAADEAAESAPADRVRARRLMEWAQSAVDAGDYEKAIQRAYYACRLLGVDLR